jgi:hypothetical protein
MVCRREVSSQPAHGGQAHLPGSDQLHDGRESTTHASGLDAIAGGVLGEPKGLGAIRIERPVATGLIDGWPLIEGRQVGQELGERVALAAGERAQADEEVVIGEGGGGGEDVRVHAPGVSRPFSESGWASRTARERRSSARSTARGGRDSLAAWRSRPAVQRAAPIKTFATARSSTRKPGPKPSTFENKCAGG